MKKYFIEIKNRFMLVILAILSLLFVSFCYKEILLFLIIKPSLITNTHFGLYYFIFTDVTEVFSVYLKVTLFLVIQILVLFLFYQFLSFLSFALFKKEYLFIIKLFKIWFVTWLVSWAISSCVLIPFSWDFFFNFQNLVSYKFISLYFEPKISEYLNFCVSIYSITLFYFLIFASLFFMVNYFNSNTQILKKFRKLYYYIFVIFSTLITPPDIISQLFVSFLLIIFFELLTINFIFKKVLVRKIIKTD
jgi:sec-independent protein translocase protein TatC